MDSIKQTGIILLDQPYISDFLKDTIRDNNLVAIDTGSVISNGDLDLLSSEQVISRVKRFQQPAIYTTAENAIGWICKNLNFTDLPEKINAFKNKLVFRELTKDMHPDFYYKQVGYNDLDTLEIKDLPKPFIIKPAIGFFSMAVRKVNSDEDWPRIKDQIKEEVKLFKDLYPLEVMDTSDFIIEEIIQGEEFAFDSYFDDNGEPIILGIMQHVFSSESDVSDRLYMTSTIVLEENLHLLRSFLIEIGKRIELRNFPLHTEVRINNGKLMPIEINPLRFGAWCTSAELMHYAFGVNSYLNFVHGLKPNWEQIIRESDNCDYAILILENPPNTNSSTIKSINYEKLASVFTHLLELRKIDYHKFPQFAILYVKVEKDNFHELDRILKSDLREFVNY